MELCALGLKALKLLLISLLRYTFIEYITLCGSVVCSVFEIEKIYFNFGSDFLVFILISVFSNQLRNKKSPLSARTALCCFFKKRL